jgi:hypothetical protein
MLDKIKLKFSDLMQHHFWTVMLVLVIVLLLGSYGLALADHPESRWLWCGVAGLC